MNKLTLILMVFLLQGYCISAFGQYDWFESFNGADYIGAEDLSIDKDDNVLVIGNFRDGVSIDGTSYAGHGAFVLKLTKNGDYLWHKLIRFSKPDFSALFEVDTDGAGNVYIAGSFPETSTIDGVELSSSYSYNLMVARIDPDGQLVWTKVIPNVQETYDMKVNDSGSILIYTHHYGTVTIDNVDIPVGHNSFGILLSAQGNLVWARAIGNPLHYTTWPRACALDNSGNAFFHGIYSGTLSMDGKQVTSTGGNYDYFFAQLDPLGVCQWLTAAERKAPDAFETPTPGSGLVIERGALETDHQGNVYAGGNYWQGMTIGNVVLPTRFHSETDNHLFLTKLDHTGAVKWAISPPRNSTSNTIDDIRIRNGLLYFGGLSYSQFYFSTYTTAGDPVDELVLVPLNGDIASGLGVDAQDSVYMSGRMMEGTKLQGFVFKYNYTSNHAPATAAPLTQPLVFCAGETEVALKAPAIDGATSYEWEIKFHSEIAMVTSPIPELELSLTSLMIDGDFSVRIRGVNEFGIGNYSASQIIKKEYPLQSPRLVTTCKSIFLEEEGPNIQWYRNDQLITDIDENQLQLIPQNEGIYFATFSNACGSSASDMTTFTPYDPESIFIPNFITPNNDGYNETFVISEKIESPVLTIFNRWGDLVFRSDPYSHEWRTKNVSPGIYYYELSSECFSGAIQGTITVKVD